MSAPAAERQPQLLFKKARVTRHDERVFMAKLLVALVMVATGCFLALRPQWPLVIAGVFLLGAAYTHMVELQHQCLHHSSFRNSKLHRAVGVPLGLPLLVVYSHYRVQHLQHHRYLGTPQDSEFFGFDARQPLTWRMLIEGTFDYVRLAKTLKDIARGCTGRWTYDLGQISERRRREVMTEYRILGALLLAIVPLTASGMGDFILRLWLLPLLFAVPMHFLLELPEHILCDSETTDVLRNTRSIRGSWLSTWFTNGNNLHVEHHAAMVVPINRLLERHDEVRQHGAHVERSYVDFYRLVLREARKNSARTR